MDVDEGRNALFVGITDEPATLTVRSSTRSLGIPEDAVVIEPVGQVVPLADSVGNYFRPVVGGLRIGMWTSGGSGGS